MDRLRQLLGSSRTRRANGLETEPSSSPDPLLCVHRQDLVLLETSLDGPPRRRELQRSPSGMSNPLRPESDVSTPTTSEHTPTEEIAPETESLRRGPDGTSTDNDGEEGQQSNNSGVLSAVMFLGRGLQDECSGSRPNSRSGRISATGKRKMNTTRPAQAADHGFEGPYDAVFWSQVSDVFGPPLWFII